MFSRKRVQDGVLVGDPLGIDADLVKNTCPSSDRFWLSDTLALTPGPSPAGRGEKTYKA
jgi:hypothetical protein